MLLLLATGSIYAQDTLSNWIFFTGNRGMDCIYSIDVDSLGAVYAAGRFEDTLHLGDTIFIAEEENRDQLFIAKFDSNGNSIWAHTGTGTSDMTAYNIRLNSDQDIVVSGVTQGPLDLGDTLLAVPWGNQVLFLAEYSTDGEFHWAKAYGHTDRGDQGNEMKEVNMMIDNDDNILVSAPFDSWDTYFDTINLDVPYGFHSYFYITKFDKNGNALWANAIQSENQGEILSILSDKKNNVIIGGYHYSGDLSVNDSTLNISGHNYMAYLIKFDQDGNMLSHNGYKEYPLCTAIDSEENIYFANWSGIAKYDSAGKEIWRKSLSAPLSNLFIDDSSYIHLSGSDRSWYGPMRIDNDSVSLGRAYIARLTSDGDVDYMKSIGDYGNFFCDLDVDLHGNPIVAGTYFSGAILSDSIVKELYRVDSETGDSLFSYSFYEQPMKNNGYLDMFLAKFSKTKKRELSTDYTHENTSILKIFPNPSTSRFRIAFNQEFSTPCELLVYGIEGRLMYSKSNIMKDNSSISISCEHWPEGLYICVFKSQDSTETFKLIKR